MKHRRGVPAAIRALDSRWLVIAVIGIPCVGCNTRHANADAAEKPSPTPLDPGSESKSESKPTADPPAALMSAPQRCQRFCAHTEPLHCGPGAKCEQGCEQMLSASVCRSELLKFFDCAEHESLDHWECDTGTPSIKDGWCDAPQAAFAACLQSAGGH